MRSAQEWHKERLHSNDCFTPEWIERIQREAFDAGASAALSEALSDLEFEEFHDAADTVDSIEVAELRGRP